MFKVTIAYEGTQATLDTIISSLTQTGKYALGTGIAYPSNSYADSEALSGSIYNRNVFGFGNPELVSPFDAWGVPVAFLIHKFSFTAPGQRAVLENVDHRDAAFYRTLQDQLADSGFVITIEGDGDEAMLLPIDISEDDFVTVTIVGGTTFSLATNGVIQPDGTTGVRPGVRVVDRFGNELKLGKAYLVAYSDNTAVGTGTITVTGIGAYTGSVDTTFTITA